MTVAAACQLVNAALGVSSLFARRGSSTTAQIEMLRAISSQLRTIQDGILLLLERADEIMEMIGDVPDLTLERFKIDDLNEARDEFQRWSDRQSELLQAHGIVAVSEQVEVEVLESCRKLARSAAITFMNEGVGTRPQHALAVLVATAAYIEISALSSMLCHKAGLALRTDLIRRAQSCQGYRDWFRSVLNSEVDGSLGFEIARARASREAIRAAVGDGQPELEIVTTNIERAPASLFGGDYAKDPCQPVTWHPNYVMLSVYSDVLEIKKWVSDSFDTILSDPDGADLLTAFDELSMRGLLSVADTPVDVRISVKPLNVNELTYVCPDGPRPGLLPYGGRVVVSSREVWQGQKTLEGVRDLHLSTVRDYNLNFVNDGVRLIALCSVKSACLSTIEWLDHVEAQGREVAEELSLQPI